MFDSSIVKADDSNPGPRSRRRESAHTASRWHKSVRRFASVAARGSIKTATLLAIVLGTLSAQAGTPPTTPTGVSATTLNCAAINVSWTASTAHNPNSMSSYSVYRNGSLWKSVPASVTSTNDTGLSANTPFSYYVVAVDTGGNKSTASAIVSATTSTLSADTTAPTPPGTLRATPSDCHSVALVWTAASDPAGSCQVASGIQGYQVFRGTSQIASVSATSLNFTYTGLSPNTYYTCQVKALDGAGNASSAISTNATTTTCPGAQTYPPGQVQIR